MITQVNKACQHYIDVEGRRETLRVAKYSGVNSGKLAPTMERYGIGRATVEKVAKDCNAKVKIGGSALYLWDRMDKYFADQADRQGEAG